ncbi:MAG: DUF3037 domain-containing protein [Acidobacteria bacterium]|nr:DUF3037 domain-containing protein [Acidobacteriota bacterium]
MERMKNCEYCLVRYAPSALRETHVPIGLFLFDDSGQLVRHQITQDWRPVRCLDPEADVALLQRLPSHFDQLVAQGRPDNSEGIATEPSLYEQLNHLQEEFAGSVQIAAPRGVRTDNPEKEFHRLFREHVERLRPRRTKYLRREGSRPWVHALLSEALKRHALWDYLQKDISVEEFTVPGDGFRIDFSYRPNGIHRYLHALSLERDWNQAKLLSYTFWRIRQKAEASLTAIVADANPALSTVQSCRQILLDSQIAVQPLSELDGFLQALGGEMRAG